MSARVDNVNRDIGAGAVVKYVHVVEGPVPSRGVREIRHLLGTDEWRIIRIESRAVQTLVCPLVDPRSGGIEIAFRAFSVNTGDL